MQDKLNLLKDRHRRASVTLSSYIAARGSAQQAVDAQLIRVQTLGYAILEEERKCKNA